MSAINLLYDPYPCSVSILGTDKRIITDFRDWLRFYDMLRDEDGTDQEKMDILLKYYLDPLSLLEIMHAKEPLIGFFNMTAAKDEKRRTEEDISARRKLLWDYRYDAACIIADFYHDYRIDLTARRLRMHWWKFRILLEGLSSETEFKQRVMYRNTDTGQIKDARERSRIQKIQRAIAIPQPEVTDFEVGDMFW